MDVDTCTGEIFYGFISPDRSPPLPNPRGPPSFLVLMLIINRYRNIDRWATEIV